MENVMKTIWGAIVGDIIGSAREFHPVKKKDFKLFPKNARFTDDTVMTLAVASWLEYDKEHSQDGLIHSMLHLGNDHLRAGYGHSFLKWLTQAAIPYNSWGNGSAMRVSAVGLYAKTLEECLRLAEQTAVVSHNHPEGIKGAQAVAACMFIALHWNGDVESMKTHLRKYVSEQFGYNLDHTLVEIRPTYRFDVSCQGSVPESIIAFLEADSYEETIRNAVSLGGDADTMGAIAGAIAACVWPVPREFVLEAQARMPLDLRAIAVDFEGYLLLNEEN